LTYQNTRYDDKKKQMHIYKFVKSLIIITPLHQHVSVTLVTINRAAYNKNTVSI